jgi:hypothetical protein
MSSSILEQAKSLLGEGETVLTGGKGTEGKNGKAEKAEGKQNVIDVEGLEEKLKEIR